MGRIICYFLLRPNYNRLISDNMSNKTITLRSADGQNFEVSVEVAKMSETVKTMLEDCGDEGVIPLPNVQANILVKVIDYCNKSVAQQPPGEAGKDGQDGQTKEADEKWKEDFCKDMDQG